MILVNLRRQLGGDLHVAGASTPLFSITRVGQIRFSSMATRDDESRDEKGSESDDESGDDQRSAPSYEFSGKRNEEKKDRAREAREEKEDEDEKRSRRTKRLRRLGIAVGIAAAIVLIAVLVSSRSSQEADEKGGQQQGPVVGAAAVNKRFEGIEQDGLSLGDPKAPVTLIEFADLRCPFCKKASDNTLPTLVDKYVRAGKLRIEFRNFAILGPDSEKAARALAGAAEQGKAWQFIDLWYLNQGDEQKAYVNDGFIRHIAGGVQGLDAERVVQASNDQGETDSVAIANTEAQKFGINSTPSYLIARRGEEPQQLQVQDPSNPALFGQAIDRLLGQPE